jgi:uncharacterized protein
MPENLPKWASPELQFNVAQLLKEATGATRNYSISATNLSELDAEVRVVSPITGHVKFMHTGPNILVAGALKTTIQKECGRCLTTFTEPVSIELEEEFYPAVDVVTGTILVQAPEADEANRIDEHHILDLTEVVRQQFLLESDSVLYCRPDCKGLCPHCGQDRNIDPCNCQDEVVDMRWAGLLELETED